MNALNIEDLFGSLKMVNNDNYCLCSNQFEKYAKTSWQESQMDKDYFDVTLACEDQQIKTHKIICLH